MTPSSSPALAARAERAPPPILVRLVGPRLAAWRQVEIVDMGGLDLLLPLTESTDIEVQRLAAHALANLSVNGAASARARAMQGGGGLE